MISYFNRREEKRREENKIELKERRRKGGVEGEKE
jgi:hypothetical protein